MIVVIDSKALQEIESDASSTPSQLSEWASFLMSVYISTTESLHLFIIEHEPTSLLKVLSGQNMQRELQTLKLIDSKQYTYEQRCDDAKILATVSERNENFRLEYNDGRFEWIIPWPLAIKLLRTTPVILGENDDDAKFWNLSTQHLHSDKPNSYNLRGGGGDTTFKEIDQINNSADTFCFCMVDSDKKQKIWSDGETAKKAVKAASIDASYVAVHKYEARTIENMIPPELYDHKASKDYKPSLLLRQALISSDKIGGSDFSAECVWRYFPVKKGTIAHGSNGLPDLWRATHGEYIREKTGLDPAISGCGTLLQNSLETLQGTSSPFTYFTNDHESDFKKICTYIRDFKDHMSPSYI